MGSVAFQASDEIVIAESADRIWPILADFPSYPRWWPSALQVRADPSGREVEIHPRGGRPFRCRKEEAEAPRRLRVRYPGPFIEGTGEWRLEPAGAGTRVVYAVDVRVRLVCARLMARLIDLPRFHSRGIAGVLENLARELKGPAGPGADPAGGASTLTA